MARFGMLPSLLRESSPRERWRWWAGVGLVLLAGLLAARPAYQASKRWRARTMAVEAERSIQAERWEEAFRQAQAAYQLVPTEPASVRAVAHLYTRLRQEQAFGFWESLLTLSAATEDDRLNYLELAIDLQRPDLAEPLLQRLLREAPDDLQHLRLASKFYLAQGDDAQALRFVQKAATQQPRDPAVQFALQRLLLRSTKLEERQQAVDKLWTLTEGRQELALDALVLLAGYAALPRHDLEELVTRLERHPLARPEHHILALELQIRLAPASRDSLIGDSVALYRTAPREKQVALGRWLNSQSQFAATVELISPKVASSHQDLFLVRLDALAGLRRWAEVGVALTPDSLPIEPWMRELYRARAAQELGDPSQAEFHWRRVHLDAAREPQALQYIATYADRIGATKEAAKAYRKLTEQRTLARPAYLALVRLAEQDGNTRSLREIMREMTSVFPQDPAPRNDLAYLNLLLGDNLTTARDTAAKLLDETPTQLAYRVTLALAQLRLQQPAEAKKLFEKQTVNWAGVLPGWQAVYSAVLLANGQTNAARAVARMIPAQKLKPEEKALLEGLL